MKTRIIALFAGLLAVLPMTSVWAGGSTTTYYYGALKATVSSTGGGKVYAATSNSTPSSDKYVATNVQSAQNKSESQTMTFYAFAQANEGYEFGGWATSDGGAAASTDNPYAVSFDASSTTDGSPTVQTVYALFSKKQLAAFSVFSILYLVTLRRLLKRVFNGESTASAVDFRNSRLLMFMVL